MNKVSVDNVGRERVKHKDLLEKVVTPRREEVGTEDEGETRPGEVGGDEDGFGANAVEAAVGLVVPSVDQAVLASVVTVMSAWWPWWECSGR